MLLIKSKTCFYQIHIHCVQHSGGNRGQCSGKLVQVMFEACALWCVLTEWQTVAATSLWWCVLFDVTDLYVEIIRSKWQTHRGRNIARRLRHVSTNQRAASTSPWWSPAKEGGGKGCRVNQSALALFSHLGYRGYVEHRQCRIPERSHWDSHARRT